MIPQQWVKHDGRMFLINTVARQDVTEHPDGKPPIAVDDALAKVILYVADQAKRSRLDGQHPQTELSEVLIGQFEMDMEIEADPFVRAAIAFVVQAFLANKELAEWLDRLVAGEAA